MQRLILPLNNTKLAASYQTGAYYTRFGCVHYGADLVSVMGSTTVYASGGGTVVAAGWDNVVGNLVVVRYHSARNHRTGETADLLLRYFHLAIISVKQGQQVTKDTVLGRYGNTGQLSTGAHLHLEADTDVAYPLFSPTVRSSSLLRGRSLGAHDRTMSNPIGWLHCKPTGPDWQTFTTAGDAYIRAEDKSIPNV